MAEYILYRYQFSPIQSNVQSMFPAETENMSDEDLMQNKQTIFASLFDEDVELKFKKGKKFYNHKMLFCQGGFFVFKIANDKSVNLEENFTKCKHDYSPSCNVIIDNRKDIQIIAVEEKKNVFKSTDVASSILQDTFSKYLQSYRLSIDIRRIYDETDFWTIVAGNRDSIEKVRFRFSYPNLPALNKNIKEAIAEVAKSTASGNSEFTLEAQKGSSLNVSEEDTNLSSLVQMSADGGEEIKIKIKKLAAWQKVGDSSKSIEIKDLDVTLSNGLFEKALDKLSGCFNKLFR